MTETIDPPASRKTTIALAVVLLVIVAGRAASGADTAFHFSGPPVDGPFQLLNALRRIAAGQRGGADFQFFHGLGVPYLHYVPYRLFGGDLTASELSRQLIAILAYPAVVVLFIRAFVRDWSRVFSLALIVYCVSIMLPLPTITTPSVSMLGVRSSVATLAPAAMYVFNDRRRRIVATGAALGAALLLGTEQGLAATIAYVVVSAVAAWKADGRRARVIEAATVVAVAVITLVVALLVIGGPRGVAGALRYNFRLVPRDQFWYFGAPASVFAPDWPSVFALMRQMPRIPLAIVGAVGFIGLHLSRLVREQDGELVRKHMALATAALYGLVSCAAILGIFYDTYVESCIRVVLLLGAVELERLIVSRRAATPAGRGVRLHRWLAPGAGASVLILVAAVPSTIGGVAFTLPHLVYDHGIKRQPGTLDAFWSETLSEGQRIVDEHRDSSGRPPVLWSTFSGWIEARNGTFNPTQFDYAMHALGPANRAAYVDDFRRVRPTLVQTVLPTYLMAEIWMEQTSWDLYEEILRNYRPIGETRWSIYWERLPSPNPPPLSVWSAALPTGARSVTLPVSAQFHGDTAVVLLDVQIDYQTHNPLGALPFIGAIPRYFVSVDGGISRLPVTLDPYTTSARFPVLAKRGQDPILNFTTYSLLPGASFDVTRIQVAKFAVDSNNIRWLISLINEERGRQPLGPGGDSTGRYRWR